MCTLYTCYFLSYFLCLYRCRVCLICDSCYARPSQRPHRPTSSCRTSSPVSARVSPCMPLTRSPSPPSSTSRLCSTLKNHPCLAMPPLRGDHSLLGQHTNLLVGLDGIHSNIKHTSRFSYNARKRLESLQYNVKLMDFFTQDFACSYLHSIGVTSDNHLERRRRFDVLLSALVDRVEVE